MEREASQPQPSSPDYDTLSHSNQRRRTRDRTTKVVQEQPESSNALTVARRTLGRPSPQPDQSPEMTPAEGVGAIKYTRTGRVSRANKGKRVHHCDCGKTYTRAEHLKRHQQNHKPGAFPCDVQGCGRSFYREDLLVRHKARHNNPLDSPDSMSPRPSPRSQPSEPSPGSSTQLLPPSAIAPELPIGTDPVFIQTSVTRTIERDGRHQAVPTRQKRSLPTDNIRGQIPIITTQGYTRCESGGYNSDSSLPHSLSGRNSPITNSFNGQSHYLHSARTRHSSDASFLDPYVPPHTSASPVSAGSSTIYTPYWGNSAQDATFQYLGTLPGTDIAYGNSMGGFNEDVNSMQLLPEYRDMIEEAELSVPMASPESSTLSLDLETSSSTKEDRYLAAYWHWIHPFFPIVHGPSFNPQASSPLLKAAMLALGANALGRASDKTNARIIHERCIRVLKKRMRNRPFPFRVCDMQAVVLVEIYSLFKSRRPSAQFSNHFEDVYQLLVNDTEVSRSSTDEIQPQHPVLGVTLFKEEFSDSLFHSYYVECKQRLLLTCYILDQQQAILFGRPRSRFFPRYCSNLPFPRPQTSWDGSLDYQLDDLVHWPVSTIGDQHHFRQHVHDVFQSLLLISSSFGSKGSTAVDCNFQSGGDMVVLPTVEYSPRAKMAYHTFMLCDNTPIRDLLAVAGESWVMSEKLGQEEDYNNAQVEAWKWASGHEEPGFEFELGGTQTQVHLSITHALKILELHQSHPKTGLLFQEWAVYLASIVIWARAYVCSSEARRHSTPNQAERRSSSAGLDQIVSLVVAAGVERNISLDKAMSILRWSQKKIASVDIPHDCGLTNSVLDVLGRLVARGNEPGWFGK